MIATLADISTGGHLASTAVHLYYRLFGELFPEEAKKVPKRYEHGDHYEVHRVNELEARLREKLAESRVYSPRHKEGNTHSQKL